MSTVESAQTAPGFNPVIGGFGADTLLIIRSSTSSRKSQSYNSIIQIPFSSVGNLNLTLGSDHWRTKGSSWALNPLVLTGVLPSANSSIARDRQAKNSGAFVQGQLGLWDALFLTYGIRADWNPNFGDKAKVLPGRYGISIAHEIGLVSVKLRGSYGRSIRPPVAGEALGATQTNVTLISLFGPYYSILPNPDLVPEHQQGGEGGVELYFGNHASLVVTRYNQTVDNLISLVGSSSITDGPGLDSVRSVAPNNLGCNSTYRDAEGHCFRYQREYLNAGSIRNQGWELTSSLNLGPLTTHGTYSWTKSRILGITPRYKSFLTGSAFEVGRSFDYIPEHTWALGISYPYSSGSVSLSINGIGMRYVQVNTLSLTASGGNLLPTNPRMTLPTGYRPIGAGYATADLNATHRFSSRIDALLQINNLTNYYQNDFSVVFATLGRQTKLGARIRWN